MHVFLKDLYPIFFLMNHLYSSYNHVYCYPDNFTIVSSLFNFTHRTHRTLLLSAKIVHVLMHQQGRIWANFLVYCLRGAILRCMDSGSSWFAGINMGHIRSIHVEEWWNEYRALRFRFFALLFLTLMKTWNRQFIDMLVIRLRECGHDVTFLQFSPTRSWSSHFSLPADILSYFSKLVSINVVGDSFCLSGNLFAPLGQFQHYLVEPVIKRAPQKRVWNAQKVNGTIACRFVLSS